MHIRHDYINSFELSRCEFFLNLGSELIAHVFPTLMYADVVHDGIWPCKIAIFEDIRTVPLAWLNLFDHGLFALLDDDGLTRKDVHHI